MIRKPAYSGRFKRDFRLAEKRGKDLGKLEKLMTLIANGTPLPPSYGDHPLRGEWKGFRDAHVEADWVLIYRLEGDAVYFERTGTHSDLFDE